MEVEFVTIKKLADVTGYTVKAFQRKIQRGVFLYGKHYIKDPDGRIQFNLEAYNEWVRSGIIQGSKSGGTRSASTSSTKSDFAEKL